MAVALTALNRGPAGRLARVARLGEWHDLGFLLILGLAANGLAAGGIPRGDVLVAYLFGAVAMRSAAWVFHDLAEVRLGPPIADGLVARGVVEVQTAVRLFAALFAVAFVAAAYLGREVVLFAPLVWVPVVAFPYVRRRSFLSPIVLALGFAGAVPIAWLANDQTPGIVAWLLFVFALLWGTAFLTLHALPRQRYERRVGIRSLVGLVGDGTPMLLALLLTGALAAVALAARRAELGPLFEMGWFAALAAGVYQVALVMRGRPGDALRAYYGNWWLGLALAVGIIAHYVCTTTSI